jgi:hypothetical protein
MREIKELTVVINTILSNFYLVYKDVAVKGPWFLEAREVGCPHPE